MKKLTLIAVACGVVLVGTAVAGDWLAQMSGTFSGGSTAITNGGSVVEIHYAQVTGTESNFSMHVVNVAGITNWLAPSDAASVITNRLVYSPTLPFPWHREGVLTLTTTSTNAAKYVIYRKRDN